jgi:hypothetical protein
MPAFCKVGFLYHADWMHDDSPPIKVRQGQLVSVPYSMDSMTPSSSCSASLGGEEFPGREGSVRRLYAEELPTRQCVRCCIHGSLGIRTG